MVKKEVMSSLQIRWQFGAIHYAWEEEEQKNIDLERESESSTLPTCQIGDAKRFLVMKMKWNRRKWISELSGDLTIFFGNI